MKRITFLILLVFAGAARCGAGEAEILAPSAVAAADTAPAGALPPIVVSYELAQVVKLADAGIAEPVLLAYVDNSRYFPPPTADELLYLKAHKLSGEIITAVIKRGAELQQRAAQAGQSVQAVQPASTAQIAPAVAPQPAVTYVEAPAPAYAYAYAAPVYSGYPTYGYGYVQPFFAGGVWSSGARNNCWRGYPAPYTGYRGAGYRGSGANFRVGVGVGTAPHGAPLRGGFGAGGGFRGAPAPGQHSGGRRG